MNPDLEAAREQLRAAERRANSKMQRLKRENRADVRGTKYDPTVGASVDRLNMRQVQARLNRVNTFMSRKTQFHGDAVGRIMTDDVIKRFRRVQRDYNAQSAAAYEPFKKIRLPDGKTVESRHRQLGNRKFYGMVNPDAVIDVAKPLSMRPRNFTSQKNFEKFLDRKEDELKDLHGKRMRDARKQFEPMVTAINDTELRDRVSKLSDKQFELLWFHSIFVEELAAMYANYIEAMFHGKSYDPTGSFESRNTRDMVKWAARKKFR